MARNHWIKLVAFLHEEKFIVYDSFGNELPQAGSALYTVKRYLMDLVRDTSDNARQFASPINEWPVSKKAKSPRQKDGGSCGAFVLWVLENLE